MDLLSLKLIVLGISGLARLFFGLIPLLLIRTLTKSVSGRVGNKIVKYVISLLMFFGGGVLLATCFLHMMPEVRASFSSAALQTQLPVPELIFIGGFFLVYLLEEAVHGIIHRRRANKAKTKSTVGTKRLQFQSNSKKEFYQGHDQGMRDSYPTEMMGKRVGSGDLGGGLIPRIRSPVSSSDSKLSSSIGENYCYIDPDWWRDTVQVNSQLNLVSASVVSVPNLDDIPCNSNGRAYGIPPGSKDQSPASDWSPVTSSQSEQDEEDDHDHSHIPIETDESVAGAIRNLLIIIAISFHGVFEGLAIGLQGNSKDVWALFLAVSLHECIVVFCIGVELISASTKLIRMITYITVVSLVCPLGIAIGIVISENSVAGTMAQTLLIGSLQASLRHPFPNFFS